MHPSSLDIAIPVASEVQHHAATLSCLQPEPEWHLLFQNMHSGFDLHRHFHTTKSAKALRYMIPIQCCESHVRLTPHSSPAMHNRHHSQNLAAKLAESRTSKS